MRKRKALVGLIEDDEFQKAGRKKWRPAIIRPRSPISPASNCWAWFLMPHAHALDQDDSNLLGHRSFKMGGEGNSNSPTSSIDSSSDPCLSSSSVSQTGRDLSTDLRLGLSISISSLQANSSNASGPQFSNWPPIKSLLRSTLAGRGNHQNPTTFFVKVYMEGIPIGRKLDLYAHDDYDGLIRTLCLMFSTTIILTPELAPVSSRNTLVLTYEDKEGDWMMVGDVPWELFLTTVKRLKITRADRC